MTKDELIEEFGKLAIRFSKGWHEGIKIDASDIMLFNQIAEALAQPTSSDYALGYSIGFGEGHSAQKALAHCPDCGQLLGDAGHIHTCSSQPEQEPVAWLTDDERKAFERFNETCEDGEGYDVPRQMMKRLAEIGVIHHTSRGIYGITKFGRSLVGYTTPPQRTFVGLAAEDRLTAKYMQDAPDGIDAVIDYIEAKLKERNDHGI